MRFVPSLSLFVRQFQAGFLWSSKSNQISPRWLCIFTNDRDTLNHINVRAKPETSAGIEAAIYVPKEKKPRGYSLYSSVCSMCFLWKAASLMLSANACLYLCGPCTYRSFCWWTLVTEISCRFMWEIFDYRFEFPMQCLHILWSQSLSFVCMPFTKGSFVLCADRTSAIKWFGAATSMALILILTPSFTKA